MNLSLSHLWFRFIHHNFLIYNMCWEDVEIDRALLNIDADSRIMMITSAGCNALTYLLDDPELIHTTDINPRQTALLDLKKAVLEHGSYQDFKYLFWDGKSKRISPIFDHIKEHLRQYSIQFWDDHIHFFDPEGPGLFMQGGAGMFARFLNRIIDKKGLRETVIQLSTNKNRDHRRLLFDQIQDHLWSGVEPWIWPNKGVLSLAGIPASQRAAIGDMNGFMKLVLQSIFVEQRASENPYWGRYLNLRFENPNLEYLREENFERLQSNLNRLEFETSSFNNFISTSTTIYTHFVLLDHMDWLVGKDEHELHLLWDLLIQKSASNSKILFRTAFTDLSFIPEKAFHYFDFEQVDPAWIAKNDRVGTYTGTYLAVLK